MAFYYCLNRPQPFEVFNLRLDGKEYPCVGPAYVDRNVFFVDYDVVRAFRPLTLGYNPHGIA